MKRILSLVLAMVMVLGSFSAVFAVEPTAAEEAVEILMDLEVLKEGKLDQDLKRQDTIVLLSRLMGVEDVAKAFPSEELAFDDVNDEFYKGYIAWAVANELTEGKSETKFGFGDKLKTQEFAMFVLRVLGYGDVKFDDALAKAEELGLLENVNDETIIKRGDMAVLTLNALYTNPKDSTITLGEKLGLELPVAPAPATLEIESVTAVNLKEVEVVFNQEVNADTVVDANVKVNGLDGSVVLNEDGVTAVITVDKVLVNQGKYKVVVDKVASVEGAAIAKTEVEFTAFDATLPSVLEVIVTGPRNLTLVFSEPVDKAGKVEVKQDKLTLGNSVKVDGNKVDVQVFTNFVDGKEYTVTVKDFEDFAGYKNVINTLNFTYEKDVTPPVATVEKVEQEYVVVSFNKPVKGITADKFYHTFSAWKAVSVKNAAGDAITANDSVNKVFVYFYEKDGDKGIPAGGTVLGILGAKITDNWANALGNQEFNVSAVADRTAPEVESITVRTEDTIRITFTKNVKFARKNVEVLDDAGKAISGLYLTVTEVKANIYDVKMSKNMSGESITVSVKDVADTTLFGNILSLHTELVAITDKTAPTVEKVYYSLVKPEVGKEVKDDTYNKSRELYVVFDDAVDAETALVAANYSLVLDKKVTILSAAPSFDALNNRVKLPLTAAQANKLGADIIAGNVTLQVINVKDLAGNPIVPEQHAIDGNVSLTDTVTVTVNATSKTQLVAKFTDLLSNVSIDAFKIGAKGFTLTQSDSATATTLTFDFANADAFNTDATGITFEINALHGIKNSYGNVVEFTYDGTVADKIKPEIDDESIVVDGKIVTIEFTEEMAADTFSKYSFLVDGYTVASYTMVSDTLKLTLNKDFDVNNDAIMITYNLDVTDAKGNKLNAEKGANEEYEYAKVVAPEVDKAALNAALTAANEKVEAEYTAESWTAFQEALTAAKDLPETTQAEVDAKLAAVNAAIAKLEVKPVVVVPTVKVTFTLSMGTMGKYKISELTNAPTATKYSIVYVDGDGAEQETAKFALDAETTNTFKNDTVTVVLYDDADVEVARIENVEVK